MTHEQRIREYAYTLYEWRLKHRIPGDEKSDWLQAEKAIGPEVFGFVEPHHEEPESQATPMPPHVQTATARPEIPPLLGKPLD
jgi:hypothetical protein